MSCDPVDGKFRLLDAYVGWSEASAPSHLVGLDDPAGLRLAPLQSGAMGGEVWQWLLPARLARGCSACDLYLLTPRPTRLLRRQAGEPGWKPLWTPACDPKIFVDPVAVVAWQHRIAVADPGAKCIWVWGRGGAVLRAEIAQPDVLALGYSECGDLLAVTPHALRRYGPSGEPRGPVTRLPADVGQPLAIAADRERGLWLLSRHVDAGAGTLRLWFLAPAGHGGFMPSTIEALRAAMLPATGLGFVTDAGLCLTETQRNGMPAASCWNWYGRPVSAADLGAVAPPGLQAEGSLITVPLDSGLPRCRWHRVQLDADVPTGTHLLVQVASTDEPTTQPNAADWRPLANGSTSPLDFLIDQPPGRYLLLRLFMQGDGQHTPVLRRVRLDFPRATSLDSLPPVYRDNPRAEDFSERFLSLFDAGVTELDTAVEQFPAALDVASVRGELLPWLAGFLDLVVDPAWEPERQRQIIAALPRLYRLRGTVTGLQLAIRLVFDTEVAIQELAFERAWGALGGGTRLGSVRLFGKSRARFALGRSSLSRAPIRSWGDPQLDAASTGAYRFRVLVPPGRLVSRLALQRLTGLVESQKPAHTQASLRIGNNSLVLGSFAALGVDSVLGPLPAPVLGVAGNVRLRRMSVLWPARRGGGRAPFVLGDPLAIGTQTILE